MKQLFHKLSPEAQLSCAGSDLTIAFETDDPSKIEDIRATTAYFVAKFRNGELHHHTHSSSSSFIPRSMSEAKVKQYADISENWEEIEHAIETIQQILHARPSKIILFRLTERTEERQHACRIPIKKDLSSYTDEELIAEKSLPYIYTFDGDTYKLSRHTQEKLDEKFKRLLNHTKPNRVVIKTARSTTIETPLWMDFMAGLNTTGGNQYDLYRPYIADTIEFTHQPQSTTEPEQTEPPIAPDRSTLSMLRAVFSSNTSRTRRE